MTSLKIAVVGAGGVGGLVGALLVESGAEVKFLVRAPHLDGLRARGLRVKTGGRVLETGPLQAADDPAALGPVDLVLVAVKAWQVTEIANALRPLLGPATVVAPLQNGVEAAEQLAAALGDGPVVGGLCAMISFLDGPGSITHLGGPPRVTLGERRGAGPGGPSARLAPIVAALRAAKIDCTEAPDIEAASWEKFLFISAMSGVGAVTRAALGVVRSIPESRALLVEAMREVERVARAGGVALAPGAVERAMELVDKLPAESTASLQRDLMAGRPSELEQQTGAVVRLGRARGVPVPVNEVLLAALLPQERAARGR